MSFPVHEDGLLKAVVKGAGPAGLAAAASLAQAGFDVLVVEKRASRPRGHGRKNMVALRPEALRRLDDLGALQNVLGAGEDGNSGLITRITKGRTTSEVDGSVFEWPLLRYPPAERMTRNSSNDEEAAEYQVPRKIDEQVPSIFINLGDLEDALTEAALRLGVKIAYNATFSMSYETVSECYSVQIHLGAGHVEGINTPDLIVCASGKNDHSVPRELSFERLRCKSLSDARLANHSDAGNPYEIDFQAGNYQELESQLYSVFGIKDSSIAMGRLDHVIRRYFDKDGKTFQPVVEIQMNHDSAAHFILQHPRSRPPLSSDEKALEKYILERINTRLDRQDSSVQQLKDDGLVSWGDPLSPVIVETLTAPQYVYGGNVILIGDCAMSCSPSSGLGADIGMTVDSQSVQSLARALIDARGNKSRRRAALMEFNLRKAESAVIWSQGSRMFYLTQSEADEVLAKQTNGNARA